MSRLPTLAVWRVRPVQAPVLTKRCARCDDVRTFVSSEKFRINAQGRRLDVWLIYRCHHCDYTYKHEVLARVSPESISPEQYVAYLCNDPQAALEAALDAGGRLDDFAVDVTGDQRQRALLVVPRGISIRLDRVLARSLGWSRLAVKDALRTGRIRVEGHAPPPSARVRDGWVIRIADG